MKILKLLAILWVAVMMSVSFASCSDDDKDEQEDSLLVGTWLDGIEGEDLIPYKELILMSIRF